MANGNAHGSSATGREQDIPITVAEAQGVGQPQYGVAVRCTARAALQV